MVQGSTIPCLAEGRDSASDVGKSSQELRIVEYKMAKRVLIVDDDPAQRRILESVIRRLGYETKAAASPRVGLLMAA